MPAIPPDRWRRLSPYLDEVLDVADDERPAWVQALRVRDETLASDVEAMLAGRAIADGANFLSGAAIAGHTPSLAGRVFGAYRLRSFIGQGGSGSVWLADRCDGRFEGRAAVKLLNLALMGPSGEERFRREGTILARLRHPGIAHLIDAGVSTAGQPYLLLEHVDGQAIDEYCREHALGLEARLRLFLDVLEAVAYAHSNLTVHRDIKPANVLVSRQGRVTLLDFGIAKMIDPSADWDDSRSPEAMALTREIGRALTPEYAAPEQIWGGAVTTATDVYALGVLLYVLVTGVHPAGRDVRSPATLIRAIVDREPPLASEVVDEPNLAADEGVDRAAQFGTTAARLRRALRGDLDTIVAKALKKDPAARYPSVTALADDLQRFLRHEPISVDRLSYRAARFVRRHVVGVVASACVVALIGGLTLVHTKRLAAERDRAQREAAKALKVSEMLMSALTSVDPYTIRASGREPTLRDLLDSGATQVRKELARQPELSAELLTRMGRTYRRLGVYDKAQELLQQALAAGRAAFGENDARVAQTLHDLGTVFADQGNYAAAGRSLERALDVRRRQLGPMHPDVAVTLAELGRVYQDEGLNARAEPLHREALAIRRTVLGEGHREVAVSLSDLASVLRLRGDLAAAESLLERSLAINRKTRGLQHPNTSVTMHDLALIAASRGDLARAESMMREALSLQRRALGLAHPAVAMMQHSLSRVLREQGHRVEAAAAADEALNIVRSALGPQHPLVAIYQVDRAVLHFADGRADLAVPLLQDALRTRRHAADVVPSRRRMRPEVGWSVKATQLLLEQATRANVRVAFARAVPIS